MGEQILNSLDFQLKLKFQVRLLALFYNKPTKIIQSQELNPLGQARGQIGPRILRRKYAGLDRAYMFIPLGVETLGLLGTEALRCLVEATRDLCTTATVYQH